MKYSTIQKILLFIVSCFLFFVPLVYSFETQQIFSVNKFTSILNTLAIMLCITACAGIYFQKKIHISQKISLFFGGFLLILGSSTYFSITPIVSFFGSDARHFGMLFLCMLIMFFYLLLHLFSSEKVTQKDIHIFIFIPILLSGIISALWGILQFFEVYPVFQNMLDFNSMSGRSLAGMGQPNFFAQFLLFPFFILLYFVYTFHTAVHKSTTQKKYKTYLYIFSIFCALVLFFGMYSSGSRAGFLGLITGSSAFFILVYAKKHANIYITFLNTAIICCAGIILFYGDTIALYLGDRGNSIAARHYFWTDGIYLIRHISWTGTGLDMMQGELAKVLSIKALEAENFSMLPDRTHNFFIDITLHTGLIGLFFVLYGITKTIQKAIHNNNTLSNIALSAFIGILTAWTFGFPVLVDSILFILMTALIWSMPQQIYTLKNTYIKNILYISIIAVSIFLFHTAYSIHQSEKALYSLLQSQKENEVLEEKILKTPYLQKNIEKAYPFLSPKNKNIVIHLGEKYQYSSIDFYRILIEKNIQKNKPKAKQYFTKMENMAGNLFSQRLYVIQTGMYYGLISEREYKRKKEDILQSVPKYYFKSNNKNDARYKKFWLHNGQIIKQLY